MTPTSQCTSVESNGLVYKPYTRFLARNLSKKVRLIHESLRYLFVKAAQKNRATIFLTPMTHRFRVTKIIISCRHVRTFPGLLPEGKYFLMDLEYLMRTIELKRYIEIPR